MKKAAEEFGGVISFAGNGGTDKLIGVENENESIQCDDDPIWDDIVNSEEVDDEDYYDDKNDEEDENESIL